LSRLLVVDDLPEICDVIATYLREQGHDVVTANHATTARRALELGSYDGFIVDLVLPGSSGLALAELAAAQAIPVLMISGDPGRMDDKNGQGGTGSAPRAFLRKPFHLAELGSAVRDLLRSGTGITTAPPAHGG
jgi:DNA-binding response OmpR family regulator